MAEKRKLVIAVALNIIIFLATIGIVISYFFGNDGEYHITPMQRFWLFTTDSNLLCAVSSLIAAVFEIRVLAGKAKTVPVAVTVLKFIGTVAVLVTFTVVMCFLGPTMGYMTMLFGGTSVYMHLMGPIIAFVAFAFFENQNVLPKRLIPIGAVSVLIYGIIYMIMVFVIGEANGGWRDFYGFNVGGFWYLTSAAIFLTGCGLAALLRLVHNKFAKSDGV